nr:ATP-dependent zinc metalloprotease FtsH 3 [Paraburkholderia busanensis]
MMEWQTHHDDIPPDPAEQALPPHLLQEIERVDLLLQCYLHRRKQAMGSTLGAFLLSPEETEHRIADPRGVPHWWNVEGKAYPLPSSKPESLLATEFRLTEFEWNVLLLGLMVHIDSRYHLLFSAIQDQEKPGSLPTIELALNLFCATSPEKRDQEGSFLGNAPLVRNGFIDFPETSSSAARGWRQRAFIADRGVYHYLFDQSYAWPDRAGITRLIAEPFALPTHAGFTHTLRQLLDRDGPDFDQDQGEDHGRVRGAKPLIILRGAQASGRSQLVCTAAGQTGRETFELDCAAVLQPGDATLKLLRHIFREIRLRNACLVMRGFVEAIEDNPGLLKEISRLMNQPGLDIVCLIERSVPLPKLADIPQLLLDMPGTDSQEKERLLRDCLPPESNIDCEALSRRFNFAAHDLPLILHEADLYREQRDLRADLDEDDLRKALRLRAQQNFGKLARRSSPTRTFDDLVVADAVQQQLTEVLSAIKYREPLLERGFGAKVGYGTGISALFYGDSGTGKTMAAEVIAGQLGVDLIKIDLSAVVNKYIGETEKNLASVFDLAERDAGVLFFDEADALFGKRSETKDAQDRHANIEVSYLLQRLESYPGLVILATNNRSHLDDAFNRRFTFMIRFPFPDASLRERMWRSIWPAGFQIDDSVDFTQLAQRSELTGANIRNIALLAAWLAEADGAGHIHLRHIELALKRELAKVGRLVLESHSRESRQ